MNCGMSMVKYILFIFNLLCALCGILIIVLGSLLFANIHSLGDLKEQAAAKSFPVALVVLGAFIFIIAFFGCCGAIRESECMSMTYATLLFILLVLDIALVALLFTTKESQQELSDAIVEEAFKSGTSPASDDSSMRVIEREWKCCGKNSPVDYNIQQLISLPRTCCSEGATICNLINARQTGCKGALRDWVVKYSNIIAYAGLGIIGVELVGFIFACCLANHIRNHRRRSTY